MAKLISQYADRSGTVFATEAEADASDLILANKEKVADFVEIHFPTRPESKRGNPHASTAARAIELWIGSGLGYELIA